MIRARSTLLGRRCRFGVLSLAVAAVFNSSASAATSTWIGANGGSWSTATNWNPNGVPGSLSNVLFTPASGSYINNGSYTLSGPLGIFTFGVAGGASGPTLSQSANLFAATTELFDSGTYAQSGGTNNASGQITVGSAALDNANYLLTGGTLAASNITVANDGSGTLSQSAASDISVSGFLSVGAGTGSTGTANFSAGSVSAGQLYVGSFGGVGTLLQSGTSNISLSAGQVTVGDGSDSSGTGSFSGGTLTVVEVIVGLNEGAGTLLQGGTSSIDILTNLYIAASPLSIGTVNCSSGALTASTIFVGNNGGAGTLLQSGTSSINFTSTLEIGAGTANGTANFSGGTVNASGESVFVGYIDGAGTFIQSGTSNFNLGTGSLYFGNGTGTSGTGSFSGGTLSASGGTIIVGGGNIPGGVGTLLQSGTSDINVSNGLMIIGNQASGTGSFSGGTLNAAGATIYVGENAGVGTLLQSGTSNINLGTGSIVLGGTTGSTGTANFSGGSLNAVSGEIYVGYNDGTQGGGVGNLLQNNTSSINLGIGALVMGYGTSSSGTANLSGGSLSAQDIDVGFETGTGTLLQSGTSSIKLTTNGDVLIGNGGTGTANLSGGTINATLTAGFFVGFNGAGTLLQSGTSDINLGTGNFVVGDGASGTGFANLSGGTLNAGQVDVAENGGVGTLIQSGGAVNTNSLLLAPGGGTANVIFSGGSFNLTAGPTISTGNQVIVDPGGNFNVGTLSETTTAQLVLDGGTLAVGTYAPGALFQFNAGTFDFTGPVFTLNPQSIFPTANLTLNGGMAVVAAGTLSMNGGELVTLNGGTLAAGTLSGGSIEFNSGAVELTSAGLVIQPTAANNWLGGTVVLNSGMQIGVTNPAATSTINTGGYLGLAGGSLTAAGTLSNSGGRIVLSNPASLLSAAVLTNAGTISGTGQVSAAITNNGTILVGANDNLQLSLGLTNAGSVILQGGNLGETGSITNQSGAEIVGHGTVQTTGGILNSGSVLFSQQDSEVSGAFANTATGNTTVAGNSLVTFDNTVTNITGSQFDVVTGSTVVFAGNVSGAAAFTGGGVKEFLGNVTNAQPLITTGSSIVGTNANVAVTTVREQSMQIYGQVAFTPGGGTLGTGSLSSLFISNTSGAGLDIADHGMVIEYGNGTSPVGDLSFSHTARNYPASSIQAYTQSGFDGFNWNGPGIMSSVAENDPTGLTAVGVADENDLLNVYPSNYSVAGGGTGTWMGQPINDPNNVLVRMTYYGDGNLDGVVNRLDVTALSQGFSGLAGYVGWSDGDYTYAGDISKIDVGLLAQSYLFQGAPLGDAITAGQAQYLLALDPDMPAKVQAAFQSIAGTPEPAGLGLLGAAGLGLMGRRRRCR
jgi:hypothetical protein